MKATLTILSLILTTIVMSGEASAAQCKVKLVNGRGMQLDRFIGHGYSKVEACQDARRSCRRAIRAGYYRARVLNCVKAQPRIGRRIVHRSCSASLTGPRGRRVFANFLGNARGVRGSGVKQMACQKALRKCRQYKRQTGRYRAICQVNRY